MKPTTPPRDSATIRWCRPTCEPMKGAAPARERTERATGGSRSSIMERPGALCARRGAPLNRSLVRAGPDPLEELLELVGVEAGALADLDDLALVGLDLGDGLRDPGRDVGRDRAHPVLVAVDQVARLDPQAADLDRDAEVDHVHVGVRDRYVRGAELEAERAHLAE